MSTKTSDVKLDQYMGLMDPKIDFVFKSLFGNEKHPGISISFLNAVFGYSEKDGTNKRITKIKIENSNIDKTMVDDKYSVLDIRATLNTEEIINIEIQIRSPGSMPSRMLYYLSKMYSGQLCEGQYYDKLKRCVSIAVVNFDMLDSKAFHNKFNFRNQDDLVLSDLMELHTIELPKLVKQSNPDTKDLLVDWLLFISNPESVNAKKLQEQVPAIKEAMEVLEMLSHDKKAREIYEKRQQALHDKASSLHYEREEGIKEGLQKGLQEGLQKGLQKGEHNAQQKIAIEMLLDGNGTDKVVRYTNLSLEEVKALQAKISH